MRKASTWLRSDGSRGDPVEIPVIAAADGPLQLACQEPERLQRILGTVQKVIPQTLLRWGDGYAARCLRLAGNPYLPEIDRIAQLLGRPGAYALNFSFEMACTTACASPDGEMAVQLYRTLDWPFRLGREVVVARHSSPVGGYYNITWPGYVGVLTALAPHRFAAAINQPPMRYSTDSFGLGLPIDWLVNRWRIRSMTALPPAHLLRYAFERCASYEEAKSLLATTPVCIPVIYTLTGTTPDEGCVIERREHDAVVHEAPTCIANHWLTPAFKGSPRLVRNSPKRLAAMQSALPRLGDGSFKWLTPPVLNHLTRLVVEANAGTSRLMVRGWHGTTPATEMLAIDAD